VDVVLYWSVSDTTGYRLLTGNLPNTVGSLRSTKRVSDGSSDGVLVLTYYTVGKYLYASRRISMQINNVALGLGSPHLHIPSSKNIK
jgi:hypothetical protein